MNARLTMSMLLLLAATAGLAPGASAQEGLALPRTDGIQPAAVADVGSESGPNQFGSNWFETVIPATAFTGKSSSDTYASTGLGYLRATAGGTFWAPLGLPPGTEVEQCLRLRSRDISATGSVLMSWATVRMGDYLQGPGITLQDSASSGTVDMPGYELICAIPAAPVQIRTFADVDGDGDSEYNWHYVSATVTVDPLVEWGAGDGQVAPRHEPGAGHGDLPERRTDDAPVLQVRRGTLRIGDHRRLRHGLLPGQPRHARPDGRVPHEGARPRLAVLRS